MDNLSLSFTLLKMEVDMQRTFPPSLDLRPAVHTLWATTLPSFLYALSGIFHIPYVANACEHSFFSFLSFPPQIEAVTWFFCTLPLPSNSVLWRGSMSAPSMPLILFFFFLMAVFNCREVFLLQPPQRLPTVLMLKSTFPKEL